MGDSHDYTREAAPRILERRRRTRSEVEQKLREKGCAAADIAAVCDRFEELKLIDDREYARLYLQGRRSRPRGTRLLLLELRRKGVPEAVAQEALGALDLDGERGAAELERALDLARQSARKV